MNTEFLHTLIDFLKDPANHWLVYGIALLLMFAGWLLRRLKRRSLTIKGNNPGIAVNGPVHGNITQVQNQSAGNRPGHTAPKMLGIAADVSGILGLILAAATFYLSHSN